MVRLAWLVGGALTLSLVACSDDSAVSTPDASPGHEAGATRLARVCGLLQDPQARPLQSGDVIVCQGEECRVGESSASGSFCVRVRFANTYLFHVLQNQVQGQRSAEILFPVSVSQDAIDNEERLDLGTITAPLIETSNDLDLDKGFAGDAGDGIHLTIAGGVTTPPPLQSQVSLGATLVSIDQLRDELVKSAGESAKPVAAAALMPAATTFSQPIEFTLPAKAAAGLTPGTKLRVYRGDPESGALKQEGTATVAADGSIESEQASGLKGLGWLVVFKE